MGIVKVPAGTGELSTIASENAAETIIGIVTSAQSTSLEHGLDFAADRASTQAIACLLAEAKRAGGLRVDGVEVSLTLVGDRLVALAVGTAYN